MKSIVTTTVPAAIGPYSQAVMAGGFVFCSGQLGLNPATGQMAGPDTASQARQALANLSALLESAGSGLGQVVKTTVFLADLNDFSLMNAEYQQAFGDARPARSTVEVKRLPRDARIEIEAVAII